MVIETMHKCGRFKKILYVGWEADEGLVKIMNACPGIVKDGNSIVASENLLFEEKQKDMLLKEKAETVRINEFRRVQKIRAAELLVQFQCVGEHLLSVTQLEAVKTRKKDVWGYKTAEEVKIQLKYYKALSSKSFSRKIASVSGLNKTQLIEECIFCCECIAPTC